MIWIFSHHQKYQTRRLCEIRNHKVLFFWKVKHHFLRWKEDIMLKDNMLWLLLTTYHTIHHINHLKPQGPCNREFQLENSSNLGGLSWNTKLIQNLWLWSMDLFRCLYFQTWCSQVSSLCGISHDHVSAWLHLKLILWS